MLELPRADITLFMHQIRPLRPRQSVTLIHDTIPLRYGGSSPQRLAKRAFFTGAARCSTRVLTPSEASRRRIVEDLGVEPDRVDLVRYPLDVARAREVARLRKELLQEPVIVYIGRFDRHKNLQRLSLAFAQTLFARDGGRLRIVGGWPGEVEPLRAWVQTQGLRAVEVRPEVDEPELNRLLATSRALVLPSLEEGYGLPAFEAAASGLPVAASRTGAMTELPAEAAVLFDPSSLDELRAALDDAVARPTRPPVSEPGARVADGVLASLARALAFRGAGSA